MAASFAPDGSSVEGWIPLASLGMCSLSALLLRAVTLDWGSCLRRRWRRQRTLLPSVSGWLMLVQRLRCALEVVPGVGSCSISKVWACSGRGKVDRPLVRRPSPAASGAEASLDIGGLHL
ncbi:hypothetical protein PVAP13_5KG075400 [Panicum virgatum]|uniref:Uncharacterized protein n=1 Tax=Panicum virgatum TaxID=38727 RepID=A0A8T0SFN9_PANVG|nr:hypothetical protein PVAP13_5KG075400 [Panicum virgatum]